MKNIRAIPKYKVGQRLMLVIDGIIHGDNFVVKSEGTWYPYKNHPNGGYIQYEIEDRANECPEFYLEPFIEQTNKLKHNQ